MELAVTRDVRHRVAEAMALFDAVFSLAWKAVEESEQRGKPVVAMAGRFVLWMGVHLLCSPLYLLCLCPCSSRTVLAAHAPEEHYSNY